MSELSRFVAAAGLELYVEERGQGSPVVLLHGFTGSMRSLEELAAGLCDSWRTIRIDLVGHGKSAAPRDASAYRMASCVGQVAAVLDAIGAARPHLVGYSMGGRVALSLCAAEPTRFASALLVGASAGIADPAERAARVADDEALAQRLERDGVEPFVDAWMAQPLFASQKRLGPETLARLRAERLANRAHALAASLRGMGAGAQPPLHECLPALGLPIRLVVGERDAKFRRIASDLARRLPNARVKLIPGAGHAAHLEDPAGFLRVARSFFAAVERGAAAAPPAVPSTQPARSPTP